jgi:hypothetical protein
LRVRDEGRDNADRDDALDGKHATNPRDDSDIHVVKHHE